MASLALACPIAPIDMHVLRRSASKALTAAGWAAQIAAFAGALWLVAAGPGLLADAASTVPARAQSAP